MDKTNCLCPECGGELEVMCVSKANDSPSGLLELLCHCLQCHLDWEIYYDTNGTLDHIQRHFWG